MTVNEGDKIGRKYFTFRLKIIGILSITYPKQKLFSNYARHH